MEKLLLEYMAYRPLINCHKNHPWVEDGWHCSIHLEPCNSNDVENTNPEPVILHVRGFRSPHDALLSAISLLICMRKEKGLS